MRICVVSDPQVPFVHERKFELGLGVIRDYKPDVVVMNGDLLDCAGLGKFGDESGHDFVDELIQACGLLTRIRDAAPDQCRYWRLEGNHEERIRREGGAVSPYLRRAVEWERQKGCEELQSWQYLHYRKRQQNILRIGPVIIWHGHATGVTSNELEACELAMIKDGHWTNQLVVLGHTHKIIQPTQCFRTKRLPMPLYHCNTGTFCDPAKMRWTETLNVSRWDAGILCVETDRNKRKKKWSGEVVVV